MVAQVDKASTKKPMHHIEIPMNEHHRSKKQSKTAAPKEKTHRADATPPNRDAPDTSQKAERFNAMVFPVLVLGCFGGAFLCARTIEFRGDLAIVGLLFQIPAILGAISLAVFGCIFFLRWCIFLYSSEYYR